MIGTDPNYRVQRSCMSNYSPLATAETQCLISIKDFSAIINDPEYFKTAFFLAAGEEISSGTFSIKLHSDQLYIESPSYIIGPLLDGLEKIRLIFVKTLEKKLSGIIIYPVNMCGNVYFKKDFKTKIDLIDLMDNRQPQIPISTHLKYLRAGLPLFAKAIGLTFTEFDSIVTCVTDVGDRTQNVKSLHFEWGAGTNYFYPITPIEIADRSARETLQGFHKLYQEQFLCDYTLKARDGEITLHSIVLHQFGGEYFQNLLSSGMKEFSEKQVQLDYSLDVLKKFIDFLYLGKEVLEPELFFKTDDGLDVFELLRLAHYCQNESLVNCCTNLISLSIGEESKQGIKELADLYQNAHLQKLYEYYSPPADPAAIKA
ncbi:MAG: hypothetical protein ChlgKO_09140 [Chlamydiales bacterium]